MSRRHRTGAIGGEPAPASSAGGRAWSASGAGVPIRAPRARLAAGPSPRPCRDGGVCEARVPASEGVDEVQEQAGPLGHLDQRLGCAQHGHRLIEVCALPAARSARTARPGGCRDSAGRSGGVGVSSFGHPQVAPQRTNGRAEGRGSAVSGRLLVVPAGPRHGDRLPLFVPSLGGWCWHRQERPDLLAVSGRGGSPGPTQPVDHEESQAP
jgi:hypothetical protein